MIAPSFIPRRAASAALLAAAALALSACETLPPPAPSLAGGAREKVLETYGLPRTQQSRGSTEVWQYCEPAAAENGAGGGRRDRLRLVWLVDGVVTGESLHAFDLDGCRGLYVIDPGAPPLPGSTASPG